MGCISQIMRENKKGVRGNEEHVVGIGAWQLLRGYMGTAIVARVYGHGNCCKGIWAWQLLRSFWSNGQLSFF